MSSLPRLDFGHYMCVGVTDRSIARVLSAIVEFFVNPHFDRCVASLLKPSCAISFKRRVTSINFSNFDLKPVQCHSVALYLEVLNTARRVNAPYFLRSEESVAADFWVTWRTRSERLGVSVLPRSFPHHSGRLALNKDYRWTRSTWLSPMPNAKCRSFCDCAVLLLNGDTSGWEHILLNIVSGCFYSHTICAQVCRGENSRRPNERQVSLFELISLDRLLLYICPLEFFVC